MSSKKVYATGFQRIMDCPAGRRILAQNRNQPPRLTPPTDGAIDWTAPPIEPAEWTPPPAPCTLCGEQTTTGWLDCTCPGAEQGGHQTNECGSCGTIVYTTRHSPQN